MSDTIPSPPPDPPDPEPIPAGKARLHLAGAAVDVLIAFDRYRLVADAIGRQLDATAQKETKP